MAEVRKLATLWSLVPTWVFQPYALSLPRPRTHYHPSKEPLTKQKEQREGAGGDHSWGREGQTQELRRRRRRLWLLSLLAQGDGVDGQQAPELEVLDHGELLQAL